MATTWTLGKTSWWTYSDGNVSIKRNNVATQYMNQSTNFKYYNAGNAGKYYAEIHIGDAVGGAQSAIGVGRSMFNTPTPFVSPTSVSGSDTEQWVYKANGDIANGGTVNSAWGSTWTAGDVIGIALYYPAPLWTAARLWFSKNGVWQASGDPGNNTNPAYTGVYAYGVYIHACCGFYVGTKFTFRSDYQNHTYSPPSGFSDWDGFFPPAWTEKSFSGSILVKGDVALAEQTYEESFVASVMAKAEVDRALEAEFSFAGSVLAKGNIDGQLEAALEFISKVKASSFRDIDLFDYSAWKRDQEKISTLKYFLTLKEDNQDAGNDVPLINYEITIRDGGYSNAVAAFAYGEIDSILEKSTLMEISYVYYIEGTENLRVKLFQGKLDRITINQQKTITVQSIFRFNASENFETYDVVSAHIRKEDVQYRITIPNTDPFMRPGDKIKTEDNTIYPIESIKYLAGPGYFSTEVVSNG